MGPLMANLQIATFASVARAKLLNKDKEESKMEQSGDNLSDSLFFLGDNTMIKAFKGELECAFAIAQELDLKAKMKATAAEAKKKKKGASETTTAGV